MRFEILTEEEIQEIHEATLRVLERTGVKVHHEEARRILKRSGCQERPGHILSIPPQLVEESLKSTPPGFILYDREGAPACRVEGRNSYFGTGVTNPTFLDFETHERKPTTVADIEKAARVADFLPNLDWIMPLGSVQDVPGRVSDIYEFEAALRNTTKPIVFICHGRRGVETVLEMAAAVAGGEDRLVERPFVVSYPEPTSPLVHTSEALEKLLYSAERGIPTIYTPCPMAGATAPVTMAGVLVQANAECLSGLVVSQLKRPGVPFVIGGVLTVMDMATAGISYGAPELSLLLAGYADLARHYGIPTWGTAGCSDSKRPDEQAALETTFSCLINAQAGINLIHDPGFLEGGMTGSLEMLLITDEVAGMTKRFLEGIPVNADTLAEEVIHRVGPGGHFLEDIHTLEHFKGSLWRPNLLDRSNYHLWRERGGATMGERIRDKLRVILETHLPKTLPEDTAARVREILEKHERDVLGD